MAKKILDIVYEDAQTKEKEKLPFIEGDILWAYSFALGRWYMGRVKEIFNPRSAIVVSSEYKLDVEKRFYYKSDGTFRSDYLSMDAPKYIHASP